MLSSSPETKTEVVTVGEMMVRLKLVVTKSRVMHRWVEWGGVVTTKKAMQYVLWRLVLLEECIFKYKSNKYNQTVYVYIDWLVFNSAFN